MEEKLTCHIHGKFRDVMKREESRILPRQINLSIKQKQITDIENRLAVAKGERGGSGMYWEFEVSDANYHI